MTADNYKTPPKVSVIIATKNEEKNIGRCLESIKKQTYPEIEIILVDNNSTDRTREIAGKYSEKIYLLGEHVDTSAVENFRGAQINFGAENSTGSIIFFPDADMTFDEGLIEEVVKKSEKHDAFYVPETIIGKGLFGKIRDFERSFYNGTCLDAVRFVKKDSFNNVGGFDEKNVVFGPDDWDFTKMLKRETSNIAVTESRIFHHEEQLDIKAYFSKKRKYHTTFNSYIQKWEKSDEDIRKQLGMFYRFFGVFFENKKFARLIQHPLLALGMYYVRLRVGLDYILRREDAQ